MRPVNANPSSRGTTISGVKIYSRSGFPTYILSLGADHRKHVYSQNVVTDCNHDTRRLVEPGCLLVRRKTGNTHWCTGTVVSEHGLFK